MKKSSKLKVVEAKEIALGGPTKKLGEPSKMPGYTFGLSAFDCKRGAELAEIPGSVCYGCYARKNFYSMKHVRKAHQERMDRLNHPQWVDALVLLIERSTDPSDPVFRWHDSGDIVSVAHLKRIVEVAERTPWVRHWLPTHEHDMVREFLKEGNEVPQNLCIRLSADMIDEAPNFNDGLEDLPTSSVHSAEGFPVQVSDNRKHSIECRAYTRTNPNRGRGGGYCGNCRACWDPRVKNVSYPYHN